MNNNDNREDSLPNPCDKQMRHSIEPYNGLNHYCLSLTFVPIVMPQLVLHLNC